MPFTVCSWNILADAYVRADRSPGVLPGALDPEARRALLLDRVASLQVDVLCLQEVERGAYEDIAARLGAGFSGRYLQRTKQRRDGCAIFVARPLEVTGTREVRYAVGDGHVALIADIQTPDGPVAIATTHLKWDPPQTAVEARNGLRQATELLGAFAAGPRISCGDFNVTADDPVLARFAAAGFLDPFSSLPAPTCVANGNARRIDFLLHTPELRAEPVPVSVALRGDTPLPSLSEPSDHLPILARFSHK